MRKEYDFSRGKRGAVLSSKGRTRLTVHLENKTVQRLKAEAERTGKSFETLIDAALSRPQIYGTNGQGAGTLAP
jgi:hypothetical protein